MDGGEAAAGNSKRDRTAKKRRNPNKLPSRKRRSSRILNAEKNTKRIPSTTQIFMTSSDESGKEETSDSDQANSPSPHINGGDAINIVRNPKKDVKGRSRVKAQDEESEDEENAINIVPNSKRSVRSRARGRNVVTTELSLPKRKVPCVDDFLAKEEAEERPPSPLGDEEYVGILRRGSATQEHCPVDLMLHSGSETLFSYTLQDRKRYSFNRADLLQLHQNRMMNDAVLCFGMSVVLEEANLSYDSEVQFYNDPTFFVAEVLKSGCKAIEDAKSRQKPPISPSRWEALLKSKVLLIPLFFSKHWSVLAIFNISILFDSIMDDKEAPTTADLLKSSNVRAIHFDSLPGIHSMKARSVFQKLFLYGLNVVWSSRAATSGKSFPVSRAHRLLGFLKTPEVGKVTKQSDGTSCGWRTILAAVSCFEGWSAAKKYVGKRASPLDTSGYVDLVRRVGEKAQRARQALHNTSTPEFLRPFFVAADVDILRRFDANLDNICQKLVTSLFDVRSRALSNPKSSGFRNAAVAWRLEISNCVASTVLRNNLSLRRSRSVHSKYAETVASNAAKFVLRFPRGAKYSECILHTLHQHPTSDALYLQPGRVFSSQVYAKGSSIIHTFSQVVLEGFEHLAPPDDKEADEEEKGSKSRTTGRGGVRRFDTEGRFRMQEMYLHLVGVADVVFKAIFFFIRDGKLKEAAVQEVSIPTDVIQIETGLSSHCFEQSFSIDEPALDRNGSITWTYEDLFQMLPTKEKNSICASALEHSTALANKVFHDAIRKLSDTYRKENKTLVNKPLDKLVYFHGADLTRLHNCILSTFTKHLVKDMEIKFKEQVYKQFFTTVFPSVLDRLTSVLFEFISWNGQRFLGISRSTVSGPPSNLTTDVDRIPPAVVASKGNKKRRIIQPQLQEKHVRAIYQPSSHQLGGFNSGSDNSPESLVLKFAVPFFTLLNTIPVHKRLACHGNCTLSKSNLNDMSQLLRTWIDAVLEEEKDDVGIPFERHLRKVHIDLLVHAIFEISNPRSAFCHAPVPFLSHFSPPSSEGTTVKLRYRLEDGEVKPAIWASQATALYSNPVTEEQLNSDGHVKGKDNSLIGDFMVSTNKFPSMFNVSVEVDISCSVTLSHHTPVADGEYLGFKQWDFVRLTLVPNHGNINKLFSSTVGLITSAVRAVGSDVLVETVPSKVCFDVCFSSVLGEESEKWELLADLLKTDYFLSIIRLDDCSARESMGEALGISCALSLPPAVSYSLLDVSTASQYIHRRRTLAYRMQVHSASPKDRLSYPTQNDLEVAWELKAKKKLRIMDSTLNEEQVDAILASCYGMKFGDETSNNMSLESNSPEINSILGQYEHITPAEKKGYKSNICFVQGPPGTGKTRMITAVIKVMARIASMPRILVMTATNDAADGIQEQLEIVNFAASRMYKTVRVGRGSKVPVVMERNLHTLADTWQKKRRSRGKNALTREQIFKHILRTEQIVFTTFGSAAVLEAANPGFDMLVVEEASRISEAQFLFACNLAFGGARLPYSDKTIPPASHQITFVIGDHKQLPPHSNVPPYFPRALQDHFFTRVFGGEYNASPKGLVRHVLKKQYRMHPAIANMVGKISYEDKLETPNQLVGLVPRWGDSNFTNTIEKWDGFNLSIMSFIDTSPEGVAAKELPAAGALSGYRNPTEACAITGILVHWSYFVKPKDLAENVVVLCTYTRQVKEIRTHLAKEGLASIGVKVETVDSFQGRECNVVLLSLVRTMDLGFLRDLRRVNVALSRARQRLVIVGYGKNFSDRSTEWKSILSTIYNESFSDDGNYGFFRILRTPGTVRNISYTKYHPDYFTCDPPM